MATANAFDADACADFNETLHEYIVKGQKIVRSATTLVYEPFPSFDAAAMIEKHYSKWKVSKDPRYIRFIRQATDGTLLTLNLTLNLTLTLTLAPR